MATTLHILCSLHRVKENTNKNSKIRKSAILTIYQVLVTDSGEKRRRKNSDGSGKSENIF